MVKCTKCKNPTTKEICNECVILELGKLNFCPNCGKFLPKDNHNQMPFSTPSTYDDNEKNIGYDIYCDNCEWSGEIEPDKMRDI